MRLSGRCSRTILAAAFMIVVANASVFATTWTPSYSPVAMWEAPPYYVHDGGNDLATVPFDVWAVYVAIDNGAGMTFTVDWTLKLSDYHLSGGIAFLVGDIDSDATINQTVTPDEDGHWQHTAHDTESGTLSGSTMHEHGFEGRADLYEYIHATRSGVTKEAKTDPDYTSDYEVVRP